MNILSRIAFADWSAFGSAHVNIRTFQEPVKQNAFSLSEPQHKPTIATLRQVHRLKLALTALKPGRFSQHSTAIADQAANVTSASALNLGSNVATSLRSTEEVNTAPTSFTHNGPAWNGSTVTAPWSGLGSTADATVGGNYDGSNGQGTLTFKVTRAGTHGADDLRIRVLAPDGSTIENINIDKNDPLNQVYELSNGLTITLGAGVLVNNDFFEVDTTLVSTSYSPADPGWTGSTALPSIGGSYNGTNGTGDLTFRVDREGVHGQDDLRLQVYNPSNVLIATINVRANDPINKVYSLSNGLTFTLGAGELVKDETFKVSVNASDPNNYTSAPNWIYSSSTATFSGTYDGSNGTGILSFKALNTGVHGQNDLNVRVYRPDGSTLETIFISRNHPVNQAYLLSNGLSVTFSAGNLIKNETFTLDVNANATFSTDVNPVESTAAPAITGVYDGSQGTDTLMFRATQEGTHGVDDLMFDVFDSAGTLLESISLAGSDPINQTYNLANGLVFSLGAGSLALNETFTLDVNHLVPTSVNSDLAFNATGINDAKLEDQFTIVDGSFEINGNAITILASDSINSVLNRINNAGIDITASFDPVAEGIVLVRNTPSAAYDIILGNDTSGFVAATKLSSATSVKGLGNESTPLAALQIMSGVSSGTLDVNGVSIAIDVNTDSLQDVLNRINALLPNVIATYNAGTGHVSISSTDKTNLSISSGGTGFFAALQIDDGTYEYIEGHAEQSRRAGFASGTRQNVIRAIREFGKQFNALFDHNDGLPLDPFRQEIQSKLQSTVSAFFDSHEKSNASTIAQAFDFTDRNKEVFRFTEGDAKQYLRSLRTAKGATEYRNLFFGSPQRNDGLAEQMLEVVKRVERDLRDTLGSTGVFVDLQL